MTFIFVQTMFLYAFDSIYLKYSSTQHLHVLVKSSMFRSCESVQLSSSVQIVPYISENHSNYKPCIIYSAGRQNKYLRLFL